MDNWPARIYTSKLPHNILREVKQIKTDSQLSNHHLKHFIPGIFLFVLSNFTSISIALLSTGDDVKKKKKSLRGLEVLNLSKRKILKMIFI